MKKALFMYMLILCASVFSGSRCNECEPVDVECDNGIIKVCNSRGRWEHSLDCVGIGLSCCVDPEDNELSCLPDFQCKGE